MKALSKLMLFTPRLIASSHSIAWAMLPLKKNRWRVVSVLLVLPLQLFSQLPIHFFRRAEPFFQSCCRARYQLRWIGRAPRRRRDRCGRREG